MRSVTSEGQVRESVISDVMQHHIPHKPRVCVFLENGTSVTSSVDHSFFLEPNQTVAGGDLCEGSAICSVINGICGKIKIASVVALPPSSEPLYDLCVPGDQNFVLTNGILAHNSYSIGGVSLDINKASEYASAKENAEQQFTEQLERAKQTVKIFKGLQQPRYGIGIRSSFGPSTGRGTLTPSKFIGLLASHSLMLFRSFSPIPYQRASISPRRGSRSFSFVPSLLSSCTVLWYSLYFFFSF